jgi:hypothetical protein
MSNSKSSVADALKLEGIRFNEWTIESSHDADAKIKATERKLAAQGLAMSGNRVSLETDIIFTSIESVIDKAIAYRRQLSARVPALLEPENLTALQAKLENYIQGGVNGVRQRSIRPSRNSIAPVFISEAENRASLVKAQLNGKLCALPLEAKFGMHQPEGSTVNNLNISNTTIANLNLGNVVGDLNASIQQLNGEGKGELAENIKRLTEAIGGAQELSDDTRKEMLEHLSVVSEESAKPPEERKMGPLKSSIAALKSGIPVAAQLFGIYKGLEHALKAAGVIP